MLNEYSHNSTTMTDYLQIVSRFLEANCHNLHSSFFLIGQCDKAHGCVNPFMVDLLRFSEIF